MTPVNAPKPSVPEQPQTFLGKIIRGTGNVAIKAWKILNHNPDIAEIEQRILATTGKPFSGAAFVREFNRMCSESRRPDELAASGMTVKQGFYAHGTHSESSVFSTLIHDYGLDKIEDESLARQARIVLWDACGMINGVP